MRRLSQQIGAASIMYANDNKRALPPFQGDDGQAGFDAYPQNIFRPWGVDASGNSTNGNWPLLCDAGTGNKDNGSGIGRLIALKYLSGPPAPDSYKYARKNRKMSFCRDRCGRRRLLLLQPAHVPSQPWQ